jgi:iron only hydrogenase large subunit-like protein
MNFSKANCKNCYKCLRYCPVKAIKFKNEQAEIDEDRCIACGHCMRICPQNARQTVSDLEKVKEAIKNGETVIASVAPSFAGILDMESHKFVASLKKLGFSYVEETAVGAELVSNMYLEYIENNEQVNYISTACPSANYIVEKYYPELIKYLIPIVSPMIAHSKMLRNTYGNNIFIVFIGPCIGKKIESESISNKDALDAVLTFEEITEWINNSEINIDELKDEEFNKNSLIDGRKYPFSGGIADCIKPILEKKNLNILSVSGTDNCTGLLKCLENGEIENTFIEISACSGSCIGGPNMIKSETGYYKRIAKVKNYIKSTENSKKRDTELIKILDKSVFSRNFMDKSIKKQIASEKDIRKIMKSMGKHSLEDELNCGVCGYDTCKQKAQAVFEEMSETTMCLHYMRTRAESIRNVIFENTLNCIILLNGNMEIKDMNPPAEEVFTIKAKNVINKPISCIIDDSDFKYVKETGESIINKKVSYPKYNLDCIETVAYIPDQDIVMVALVNITAEEKNRKKLMELKENTIEAAEQVIKKQMMAAQEIASLLGETTAETKITLTKLKKIVEDENSII